MPQAHLFCHRVRLAKTFAARGRWAASIQSRCVACLYQWHTCTSSHAEASMHFEIKAVNEELRSWHGGHVVAREGVLK